MRKSKRQIQPASLSRVKPTTRASHLHVSTSSLLCHTLITEEKEEEFGPFRAIEKERLEETIMSEPGIKTWH